MRMMAMRVVRPSRPLRLLMLRRRGLATLQETHSQALQLVSGACGLPHPQKRATGGEDAWFIQGDTVGVADGVGGWARKGIDSGEYSRTLMQAAGKAVDALAAPEETGAKRLPEPLELLKFAHRSVKCQGSSTACIVQLYDDNLRAINLGDSGFIVCRLQADEHGAMKWRAVYESPNQCHYFNCPFQLGYGNGDQPEHGQLLDVPTEEGDVVIVGTDGLFDNLFAEQIATLLDSVWPSDPELDPESMEKVASCVAHTAHKAAKATKTRSPFAVAAERAGYRYLGGKMDDITVVASLVAAASVDETGRG